MTALRNTYPVSNEVFRAVYESPASLPGQFKWITPDEDVRKIEEVLGMPQVTIGAPLWLSGDRKDCPNCGRTISWLDIVTSALGGVHSSAMIAQVILGEQKYVNTETPDAIAGLECFNCKTAIGDIRSFKCHNWAYARTELAAIVEEMAALESR